MTMTDSTIKLNAPDRVGKQVVSILMDRSLTPFDRANRATALIYPLLMADSGLTPEDPIELGERLKNRTPYQVTTSTEQRAWAS